MGWYQRRVHGGVSPHAILADVVRLHKACHARGIPTVALAPSTVAHGPSTLGRQQLASLLRKWAKTTPSVVACIDMMELIPHHGPSPHWDFDDLHLSAGGSRALGRRLGDKLMHLVQGAPLVPCVHGEHDSRAMFLAAPTISVRDSFK